ncbi:hypothetical protein MSSD1_523 [Mycoplasmopsis synoviae]
MSKYANKSAASSFLKILKDKILSCKEKSLINSAISAIG